jgi:hypothetical protein
VGPFVKPVDIADNAVQSGVIRLIEDPLFLNFSSDGRIIGLAKFRFLLHSKTFYLLYQHFEFVSNFFELVKLDAHIDLRKVPVRFIIQVPQFDPFTH